MMNGVKTLRRYWIRFDVSMKDEHAPGTLLGIGVTAYSREDALQIIRDKVYKQEVLPPVADLIEDVSISELDAQHVVPNLGSHFVRGVWYPVGFQ
jgi:hypothetical protein